MTFTPGQVIALKKLRELWPDASSVLVGASALACFLGFRWRATNDIDISVSIELDAMPAGLDQLSGWSSDPRVEHRWLTPEGVKVDIIPAGPELRRVGTLRWPRSGNEMSLVGQRLAFEQAREVRVDADLTIRVAPVPVVCVLKVVAYQDQPHARTRDLEDLTHILEDYVTAEHPRRYSDEVTEEGIEFEFVSAYLLGRDIGGIVNSEERRAIATFMVKVRDENDRDATQARMANVAPLSWRRDPETLLARLNAFEEGLNSVSLAGAPR